ncbi:FecR family protein [Parabacteroides sp. 52]|uniref:FecR family protein n=1 Tax=unclassified Parabacteroides TaxID=2649774 RepID=UPI0013D6053B|nr:MULTISPECIES: FecR family protein [unclassified Parabacteroides]MDH6535038.1 transmembrane sensor [Parabacteroides sp. PM5-20]NDV55298.1 FecR family protein [Parabacteroides sp. 52]
MKNTAYIERYRSLLEEDEIIRAWMHSRCGDLRLLDQMKKENPEKEQEIRELQTIFNKLKIVEKGLSPLEKERLWNRIEKKRKKTYHVLQMRNVLRYAAVVVCVLATSLYFFWQKTPGDIPVDYESILSEMIFEEDSVQNVLLVFSDEKKMEMTDEKVELVYDAQGNISVNSLNIENEASAGRQTDGYNRLYVPYGKTMHVSLSDGTKIWVNSGSRLIYPASFAGGKREIYLDGEIYLEVAKNEKMPFVVKTNDIEVEVLGTAFNISAYTNEDTQSVVLANGSVAVKNKSHKQPTIIQPNQKYTLAKSTQEVHLDTVDVFYYICWRYNLILSDSESLSTILKRLERYYNVRVDYNPHEINAIQVKGKLDLKNTIEETLHIISMTTSINYSIEDESIKVSVNP